MNDNRRIQVDVRNMPEGVKPRLSQLAQEAGVSLTDFIRTVLCKTALGPINPSARIKELIEEGRIVADSDYVPLT